VSVRRPLDRRARYVLRLGGIAPPRPGRYQRPPGGGDERRPWAQKNVSFGDFSMATKPNAFAWPIPKEKIGAKNRDHPHEAFLTDMDVKERDLEKLGREFRDRWGG